MGESVSRIFEIILEILDKNPRIGGLVIGIASHPLLLAIVGK